MSDKKILRTFMIEPAVDNQLNMLAAASGVSKSELIRMALKPYVTVCSKTVSHIRAQMEEADDHPDD